MTPSDSTVNSFAAAIVSVVVVIALVVVEAVPLTVVDVETGVDVVSVVVSMVADVLPTTILALRLFVMYNTYASVGLRSEQAGRGGLLRRASTLRAR